MATMDSFYQWLVSLFKEGDAYDYDQIKQRMHEAGYDDVKAEDVYNAVNTMIDDGDVFTNEQTSVLEAYTGGNVVSQGGYQGAASAGASGGGSSSSAPASSGGSGGAAAASAPSVPVPPPPPLASPAYESDLEAAVQQITYVNNVTNNTFNEDNDYFSDDDTVVDNSINQNIAAAGDVNQDFDNVTATGESVANSGDVDNANLIGGGVEDSVVAQNANIEGSAVGDNNTILNDSDGAVLGEGGTSITNSNVDGPVATNGSEATQAEQIAGGDAIQADDSLVNTGSGDIINNSQAVTGGEGDLINDSNANTGDGDFNQTNIDADHSDVDTNVNAGDNNNLVDADNSVASAEGDVEGINQSQVEAAEFGEGDLDATDNIIDDSAGAAISDEGDALGEFTETSEVQQVAIEDSAGIGVSDDGPADGEFAPDLDVEIDLEDHHAPAHDHHDELTDV